MKRIILLTIIFISGVSPLWALEVPRLQGYVNDYAGMISMSVRGELERELKSFEQTDSTQVVILTLPSLEGESIEEFSIKVADQWRIGQKNKDNGVILVVAKQERKIRLEVGRGLEGRLTDLLAGRIVDLSLKPNFKRGDFDAGFKAGITSIIDAVRGEFKAEGGPPLQKRGPLPSFMTFFVILGMAILVLGGLSRIFGGVVGAVGLPMVMRALIPFGLFGVVLFGLLGLAIGLLLPSLFSLGGLSRKGGFWTGGGFPYGGGGWSSGGWGSGDSGGGFSGGGGSFGGGGASGDW
jgi:uncharacterized protein